MKHEEARSRARSAGAAAAVTTMLAAMIAAGSAGTTFWGWQKVFSLVTREGEGGIQHFAVPPGLWQLGLATTAAAVLIFACSAMLFKVASAYHQRSLTHVAEMATTRNIEAAVRLTLSSGVAKSEICTALARLGERLIERETKVLAQEESIELSMFPEILKACRDLLQVVLKVKPGGGALG
jgi:hypothetical protein